MSNTHTSTPSYSSLESSMQAHPADGSVINKLYEYTWLPMWLLSYDGFIYVVASESSPMLSYCIPQ